MFAVVTSSNNTAVNEAATVSGCRAQQRALFWQEEAGEYLKRAEVAIVSAASWRDGGGSPPSPLDLANFYRLLHNSGSRGAFGTFTPASVVIAMVSLASASPRALTGL